MTSWCGGVSGASVLVSLGAVFEEGQRYVAN